MQYLEYKPWKCTVQSRESLALAKGPQAHIIHAVRPINTALHLQHVTDHTQSQRFSAGINVFPLLCCSLLHLQRNKMQFITNNIWDLPANPGGQLISLTNTLPVKIIVVTERNVPVTVWNLQHWPRVLPLDYEIQNFHSAAQQTSP